MVSPIPVFSYQVVPADLSAIKVPPGQKGLGDLVYLQHHIEDYLTSYDYSNK